MVVFIRIKRPFFIVLDDWRGYYWLCSNIRKFGWINGGGN